MKKWIILSDTHGNKKGIEKLLPLIRENDGVLHLGDGFSEAKYLIGEFPEKAYACAGNCDFFTPLPEDGELDIESVRIFYCHGHKYGVKSTLAKLALEAKKRGCDVALYGHTHLPKIDEIDGVTLINPGALRFPSGEGGSYCYLVVNGKKITPVIVGETAY